VGGEGVDGAELSAAAVAHARLARIVHDTQVLLEVVPLLPHGRAEWAAKWALLEVYHPPVAVEVIPLGEAAPALLAAKALIGGDLVD